MSVTKTLATLYNPGEKDKDALINEFVIRLKEFENIFSDIKSSKMKTPEQHYLLIGQRGSGKTTLIQRLRYAIEDDEQLNKWLIPIAFTEEQYNITELGNLWERIAEFLEDYHNMPGIVAAMEKHIGTKGQEQKQLEVLLTFLRKNKKKVVLFIDNLGDMLDKFTELEARRLREVLQTIPEIRLIAASPIMLHNIIDHNKAMFEFFKTIRLSGLNREEIETLLIRLGEEHNNKESIEKIIKEAPERIEILRRLTGGVVRTVVMMYNVFIENEEGNPIGDLNTILDDATPLYKHKMDDLPTQQQKIVDVVARNWEAISTGEVAEKLRMDSKKISAQLKQLETNQWIEKIETDTKNHLYQVKERFFNIWYLMRYGRRFDKGRVIWLVKFMESWLEKVEIEARIENLTKKIWEKAIDADSALFWSEVYFACDNVSPFIKTTLAIALEGEVLKQKDDSNIKSVFVNFTEDVYQNPEKLRVKDVEFIKKLFSDNFLNEQREIEQVYIIDSLVRQSSKAKKFWIDFYTSLLEIDKYGFAHYMVGYLLHDTDAEKASVYRSESVKRGNLFAIYDIVQTLVNFGKDKEIAYDLLNKVDIKYRKYYLYNPLKSIVCLWKNLPEEAIAYIDKTLELDKDLYFFGSLRINMLKNIFLVSIAKKQRQVVRSILLNEKYDLKSQMEPIYYALMHYMKDEYPNEYLRMPPEMKETVEDVIKKVEEYRVKYA